MASVDVINDVSTTPEAPAWIYKASADSDEWVRNAVSVVSEDPQKYLLEENNQSFKVICISANDNGEDTTKEEGILSFDFKNQTISLKTKSISIPAFNVFHISFVRLVFTATTNRLALSYKDQHDMKMFHFMAENGELDCIRIINAFRHALFEFFKQFADNADTTVNVINNCAPIFVGDLVLSVKKRQDKEELLNNSKYTVVLGSFFMSVYKFPFSCVPLYTVYFWDTTDRLVVDNVIMLNESGMVKIESREYSFEIPNADELYPEFLAAIKGMRPKPKDVFTDPQNFVSYISKRGKIVHDLKRMNIRSSLPVPGRMSAYAGGITADPYAEARQQIRSFEDDMNVAVAKFQENEQIQLPWIMAETELKSLIEAGFVPETDIASGGLNPNSMDHFLQCIREIEENLTTQQYEVALSRLQGTRLIFLESDMTEMRNLFREDDVTLMKMIYYHSFL